MLDLLRIENIKTYLRKDKINTCLHNSDFDITQTPKWMNV